MNEELYFNKNNLMSYRDFMLNKWKNILNTKIDKYSKEYPELKNININDCAKDIENNIYNKCIYKHFLLKNINDQNILFYFFCQIYIYIYLTDIFKDIYIEKFIIFIYNCYTNNNIYLIVQCHDYILKNIIEYDCEDENEIYSYINSINHNIKKLTDIFFNQYNISKNYKNKKEKEKNKTIKNGISKSSIFENIFENVKNIFTDTFNNKSMLYPSKKIINKIPLKPFINTSYTPESFELEKSELEKSELEKSELEKIKQQKKELLKQKQEYDKEYKLFAEKQQRNLDEIRKKMELITSDKQDNKQFLKDIYNDLQKKYNEIMDKNLQIKNKENKLINIESKLIDKENELKNKENELKNKENEYSNLKKIQSTEKPYEYINTNILTNFETKLKNELSKINNDKLTNKIETSFQELKKLIELNNNTIIFSDKWEKFNNYFSNIIKQYNSDINDIKNKLNTKEQSSTNINFDIKQIENYLQDKYVKTIMEHLEKYFNYFNKNFNNILNQNTSNYNLLKTDIALLVDNFDKKFKFINEQLSDTLLKLPQGISQDSLNNYKNELINIKNYIGKLSTEHTNNSKMHNEIISKLNNIPSQFINLQKQYPQYQKDDLSLNNFKSEINKLLIEIKNELKNELKNEHDTNKQNNNNMYSKFNDLLEKKLNEINIKIQTNPQSNISSTDKQQIIVNLPQIVKIITELLKNQKDNIDKFQSELEKKININTDKLDKILNTQTTHTEKLDEIIKLITGLNKIPSVSCDESHKKIEDKINTINNKVNEINNKIDTIPKNIYFDDIKKILNTMNEKILKLPELHNIHDLLKKMLEKLQEKQTEKIQQTEQNELKETNKKKFLLENIKKCNSNKNIINEITKTDNGNIISFKNFLNILIDENCVDKNILHDFLNEKIKNFQGDEYIKQEIKKEINEKIKEIEEKEQSQKQVKEAQKQLEETQKQLEESQQQVKTLKEEEKKSKEETEKSKDIKKSTREAHDFLIKNLEEKIKKLEEKELKYKNELKIKENELKIKENELKIKEDQLKYEDEFNLKEYVLLNNLKQQLENTKQIISKLKKENKNKTELEIKLNETNITNKTELENELNEENKKIKELENELNEANKKIKEYDLAYNNILNKFSTQLSNEGNEEYKKLMSNVLKNPSSLQKFPSLSQSPPAAPASTAPASSSAAPTASTDSTAPPMAPSTTPSTAPTDSTSPPSTAPTASTAPPMAPPAASSTTATTATAVPSKLLEQIRGGKPLKKVFYKKCDNDSNCNDTDYCNTEKKCEKIIKDNEYEIFDENKNENENKILEILKKVYVNDNSNIKSIFKKKINNIINELQDKDKDKFKNILNNLRIKNNSDKLLSIILESYIDDIDKNKKDNDDFE